MIYDVIVLGATFAAAGLATEIGERCLVLERRPQAGYEFLNALHFGVNYATPLASEEAKALHKKFADKGAFDGERICLFDCASLLYQTLEGKNILLNVELIAIEKDEKIFTVTVHGASGYRSFKAKKVIDTTPCRDMIQKKTLNLLVNNKANPKAQPPCEAAAEKWGYPGDVLVKISVDADADYIEARKQVKAFLEHMPAGYRVAYVADCFAQTVSGSYPQEKDGVALLPSVFYDNPLLAFDAGVMYARGGVL